MYNHNPYRYNYKRMFRKHFSLVNGTISLQRLFDNEIYSEYILLLS